MACLMMITVFLKFSVAASDHVLFSWIATAISALKARSLLQLKPVA